MTLLVSTNNAVQVFQDCRVQGKENPMAEALLPTRIDFWKPL